MSGQYQSNGGQRSGSSPTSYQAVVQQIRERIDIVSIVSRHVPLKRAGSSFKACCPFHQEKTPSFYVHPDKQFFYCFGCGAKGDAFGFLMDYEGKRFPEVIQELADEMGLALPESGYSADVNPEEDQKKEKLYQLNHWARQFYAEARTGPSGQFVRDYLLKRGISEEMIEAFGLGYAPDDWTTLTDMIRERGGDLELAQEVGLIKQAENSDRIYDRFRHRLMFPIVLPSGRIAGFGGRVLRDEDGAKYLNSPESIIFQKSQLLYGLDLAGPTIRRSQHAILVEGYLDVICMHQYGFAQTIAALGTALNENHLYQLKRHTKRVVLLFDGDKAGIKAAERALQVLLPGGLSVDILTLPDGDDPDDFLRKHGSAEMATLLEEKTQGAFDFWLGYLRQQTNDDPVQLRDASQKVLELIQKVNDPILRDIYLKRASSLLGIEEVQLRRGLMRVVPRPSATSRQAYDDEDEHPPLDIPPPEDDDIERPLVVDDLVKREQEAHFRMIKIVLENPDLFPFVIQAEMTHNLHEPILRDAWSQLISDLQEGGTGPELLESVLDSLGPMPGYQRSLAHWLMKEAPFDEESLHVQWRDIANQLKILQIERKLRYLNRAIKEAIADEDQERLQSLVQEKTSLQRERLEHRSRVSLPLDDANELPWSFPPSIPSGDEGAIAEQET